MGTGRYCSTKPWVIWNLSRAAPSSMRLLGRRSHQGTAGSNSPDGKVLALDVDEAALAAGREAIAEPYGSRLTLIHANFRDIQQVAEFKALWAWTAFLPNRCLVDDVRRSRAGFSFMREGELDMRMDRTRG
jgi:16S rRNA C1402 N4-methylase RsmH